MNFWTAIVIIWTSTLVFTGLVFYTTGSPWSFAFLLLLGFMDASSKGNSNKKEMEKDE